MKNMVYPECELEKLNQIKELMAEWKRSLPAKQRNLFVSDGFYPYYFSKSVRILFIGKESLGMSGQNYIETLFDCYSRSKTVGGKPLNQHRFHSRLLYIAYGILNGQFTLEDFHNTPVASEIGDTFGTSNGVSFAFMNISKSSNDASDWKSDWGLINESVDSGREFIKKEIGILEPDVIITGNIGGLFFNILDNLKVLGTVGDNEDYCDVCVHKANIGSKDVTLLDCWHFSNYTKKDFENFYKPVCEYLNKGLA